MCALDRVPWADPPRCSPPHPLQLRDDIVNPKNEANQAYYYWTADMVGGPALAARLTASPAPCGL